MNLAFLTGAGLLFIGVLAVLYVARRQARCPRTDKSAWVEAMSAENLATKADIHDIKTTQRLQSWMIGFNLAFTTTICWNIFS